MTITLFIGDMNDDDQSLELGLAPGEVTVTFRQGAGLTNRTEGGSDDWFVNTSEEPDPRPKSMQRLQRPLDHQPELLRRLPW